MCVKLSDNYPYSISCERTYRNANIEFIKKEVLRSPWCLLLYEIARERNRINDVESFIYEKNAKNLK